MSDNDVSGVRSNGERTDHKEAKAQDQHDSSRPGWSTASEIPASALYAISKCADGICPGVMSRISGDDFLAIVNGAVQTLSSAPPNLRKMRLNPPPTVMDALYSSILKQSAAVVNPPPQVTSTARSKRSQKLPKAKATGASAGAGGVKTNAQPLAKKPVTKKQSAGIPAGSKASKESPPLSLKDMLIKHTLRTFRSAGGRQLIKLLNRPQTEEHIRQDIGQMPDEDIQNFYSEGILTPYDFMGYLEPSNIKTGHTFESLSKTNEVFKIASKARSDREAHLRKMALSQSLARSETKVVRCRFDGRDRTPAQRVDAMRTAIRASENAEALFPNIGKAQQVFLSFHAVDPETLAPAKVDVTIIYDDGTHGLVKSKFRAFYTVVKDSSKKKMPFVVDISYHAERLHKVNRGLIEYLRPDKQERKAAKPNPQKGGAAMEPVVPAEAAEPSTSPKD